MKRLANLLSVIIIVAIIFIAGYAYLQYQQSHPSTNDAYVQANVINMAAQISGPVATVYVQDHDVVKRNQPLFDIDPKPFEIALNQAQANLENVQQQIKAAENTVKSAQAVLAERQAELTNAKNYADRINALVAQKLLPAAQGDEVTSKLKVSQAAVSAAQSQLAEAQEKLGQPGEANAQIKAAQAALAQAALNLQYTHVSAPADGYIVNFNLRPGSIVTAQQPLFALVDNRNWWVSANFKETDLQHIRPGQSAEIKVDMYPDHTFQGAVQSISGGSGEAFSLLPPENATGNWVKVTQRIPVRVTILDPNPQYPLRVGASSTVTINIQ